MRAGVAVAALDTRQMTSRVPPTRSGISTHGVVENQLTKQLLTDCHLADTNRISVYFLVDGKQMIDASIPTEANNKAKQFTVLVECLQ